FSFFFFFNSYCHHLYLHSFPTRRSSDLSDLFLSFSFHFWRSQRADTWIFGSTKEKMIYPYELPDPGPGAAPSPAARRSVFRQPGDRKSTRLNSSHLVISYAVFCLKKKKK